MAEPIYIGAQGWDDPAWRDTFYPESLPPDWRFSFYCNHLRAVLLPAETWAAATPAEVKAWAGDVFPEFRFVVELAPASPPAFDLLAPIRPQVAGVLLRVPANPDAAWLAARLAALTPTFPVCVDIPPPARTPALLDCLTRYDAGLCWRTQIDAAPRPGGKLMVALASLAVAKLQRRWLEQLAAWQGETGLAALFCDDPESAKHARVLAELMVV